MLNCGIALVLSKCILKTFAGAHQTFGSIAIDFFVSCLGALALGYIFGVVTVALLRRCENNTDMEVTFTLCLSYIAYFVCEIFLDISGLLALVVLGVSVSSYKSSINFDEEETTLRQFWQTLNFWANSFIFTVVGLIITSNLNDLEYGDIGFIIATYFTVSVIRGCMIMVLSPILRSGIYSFSSKSGVVLTWAGMRGSTGLAIALMSRYTQMQGMQNKLFIQVSGVIVLTLILNASTLRWMLNLLGIGQVTIEHIESMAHAVALLKDAAVTAEQAIRMDKHTGVVDWAWIHRVTYIENPYAEEETTSLKLGFNAYRGHCNQCKSEIRIQPSPQEQKRMEAESRLHIMRAVKLSVANQLESYAVLRRTWGLLSSSIDNSMHASEKYLLAEDVKDKLLRINYCQKLLKKHMMNAFQNFYDRRKINRDEARHRAVKSGITAFQKWCIKIYLNGRLSTLLYLALFANIIPIAGEAAVSIMYQQMHRKIEDLEKEILLFEIINAILATWYVCDAIVRINAMGYKSYFRFKINLVDAAVTLVAVLQLFYFVFLVTDYRYVHRYESLYVLAVLSSVRIVRLARVFMSVIIKNMLNHFSSSFYNSFDLAIGFIAANAEIKASAHKIVEYEEFADFARLTAENNEYNMLCYTQEMETQNTHVVCAWRSHRATIYILRNMKQSIEDMVNIYMLCEDDADKLHEEIDAKMKEIISAPRFMTAKTDEVRRCLQSQLWIKGEEMLDKITETCSIQSFQKGEVIQEAGKKHSCMIVLYKGMIQITGSNDGEKTEILPNTDSLQYFDFIGRFSLHKSYHKTLGLLGYLLQTPCVTNTVATKEGQMITIDFDMISKYEEEFGSLAFQMWRAIALPIAYSILRDQDTFWNWSNEKLKVHLEEGIFPDLENAQEFHLNPVIADAVLIQGRVKGKNVDILYNGPTYIPQSVRTLILPDNPKQRPRVVMVLFRDEKYHARTTMGWVNIDDITARGLCLAHGLKRASVYNLAQDEDAGRRVTFSLSKGIHFRRKSSSNLESDAP